MTIRLYIPPLGDIITLAEDWTFPLYFESRNSTLQEHFNIPNEHFFNTRIWSEEQGEYVFSPTPVTIPAGAKLKVDRIYIRKGQNDFNSVTFMWQGVKVGGNVNEYTDSAGQRQAYKIPLTTVRFWAKLEDVNRIVIVDPPQ